MSTTMLWGNKDPNKPKNQKTNGSVMTLNGMNVSYAANTGAGAASSSPTTMQTVAPVSAGGTSVLYGDNMRVGSGGTMTPLSIITLPAMWPEPDNSKAYIESPGASGGSADTGANGTTTTPPPTDVSYGGNTDTGDSTENGTTSLPSDMAAYDKDGDGVLSYEEYELYKKGIATQYWDDYLATEKERLETQKNSTYAAAAEAKKRAEEAANLAHERAVVDAQVAGEQNKAGYGAKAERLASMGLTGGGYSDYLNARAYAQSRGEIQAAGAEKTAAYRMAADNETDARMAADISYGENMANIANAAAKGKLDTDLTYAGNMQAHDEKEREKQEAEEEQDLANAEAAILGAITAGIYNTKDEAIAAARAKGITDENVLSNIESQWTIWDNGQKNSEGAAAILAGISAGEYTTRDDAIAAAKAKGITDENVLSNIGSQWTIWNNGQKNSEGAAAILAGISAGEYATRDDAIAAAKAKGITDENVLSNIGSQWTIWNEGQKNSATAAEAFYKNIEHGDYTTLSDAMTAAQAAGITDPSILANIDNKWTAWAVSSFKDAIQRGDYTAKEAVLEAAKAAGITSASVLSQIGDEWTEWDQDRKDQAQKDALATILSGISANQYATKEAVLQAAKDAGIYDENILSQIGDEWQIVENKRIAAAADAISVRIEKGEILDYDQLERILNEKSIYGKVRNKIRQAFWNRNYSAILEDLKGGEVDLAEIKSAYMDGNITPDQYEEIYAKLEKEIDTDVSMFDGCTIDEARAILQEYEAFFGVNHKILEKAAESFKKVYGVYSGYGPVGNGEASPEGSDSQNEGYQPPDWLI